METVLGLLGVLVYMPAVILLAAGVTLAVVKISPASRGRGQRRSTPST